jgi:hypothetical protein
MALAVERIRAAIGAGTRICVHGDYDVDGICATALAVLLLQELGADVVWHLPSRFEEGYGVSSDTPRGCRRVGLPHRRLWNHRRRRSPREGARARGRRTDHHRPGDSPGVPLVVTRSRHPFRAATGVAAGEALSARSILPPAAARSRRSRNRRRRVPPWTRTSPRGSRAFAPGSYATTGRRRCSGAPTSTRGRRRRRSIVTGAVINAAGGCRPDRPSHPPEDVARAKSLPELDD